MSCELLSKVDIFDIRNNSAVQMAPERTVVNCSKVDIFDIRNNFTELITFAISLWIALKVDIFDIRNNWFTFDVLRYRWIAQKLISLIFASTPIWGSFVAWSCELLKSWYLWYSNNAWTGSDMSKSVVNAQKLISLIRTTIASERSILLAVVNCSKVDIFDIRTTYQVKLASAFLLWIALKSWYLWYSEQPVHIKIPSSNGCELLSKVDIFDIRTTKEIK